jgi:two-component system nitrate/nitrite response regulator NarL
VLSPAPVRVVALDDHEVVRSGVALLASRDRTVSVVGSAGSVDEGLRVIRESRPDVVLLDLRLPGTLGPEAVHAIRALVGVRPRIIIFTAYGSHAALAEVMEAGVEGCILKDAGGIDLMTTIRAVHAGERVIDPRLVAEPVHLDLPNGETLTRREYQIIRRVALGETNPEISTALDLTRNTVKTYLQNAFRKLDARNRVEAVAIATELGLL